MKRSAPALKSPVAYYSSTGQLAGLGLGNGVMESYIYSADRLQLTNQTANKGAISLMNLTYDFSASAGQNGNGSTVGNSEQLMSISGTIGGQTESAAFTYDLQNCQLSPTRQIRITISCDANQCEGLQPSLFTSSLITPL